MVSVSFGDIAEGLRDLGISEGDVLLVHSSLSSFGRVQGGAGSVIRALECAIGESGALLMPSFPSGSEYELVRKGLVFDVRKSPSEMGAITESFRRMEGVRRSLNPTHSLAGRGSKSWGILKGHERCMVSCGPASPFEKFCRQGGKILLMGVDHGINTTLHYVENVNGAPTLSCFLFHPAVVDCDGKEIKVPTYPHLPGLPRAYEKVEPILNENGIQRKIRIGASTLRVVEALHMARLIGALIREDPLFLIKPWKPHSSRA
jgi:aminoglycoside 3-N-acetyltransferase